MDLVEQVTGELYFLNVNTDKANNMSSSGRKEVLWTLVEICHTPSWSFLIKKSFSQDTLDITKPLKTEIWHIDHIILLHSDHI